MGGDSPEGRDLLMFVSSLQAGTVHPIRAHIWSHKGRGSFGRTLALSVGRRSSSVSASHNDSLPPTVLPRRPSETIPRWPHRHDANPAPVRHRRSRAPPGTAGAPGDFQALLSYSPYHDVRVNRCYPATLLAPGEPDEVTPPLHAYKFGAALQYAQSCASPILLRVTWNAGHCSGATTADAVGSRTDQLSFLVRTLARRGWEPRRAF